MTDHLLRRARAALGGPRQPERPSRGTIVSTIHPDGASTRDAWVAMAQRLALPVLDNLAGGTLRARMPVEQRAGVDRTAVTHLEAVGRLLAGIAPWLELEPDATPEGRLRAHLRELTLTGLHRALDPDSPDALSFEGERQPLVDAAYLGLAIVRAPRLFAQLDATARDRLVERLRSTRMLEAWFNNWLMFPATIEATLAHLGEWWDRARVDYAIRQHEQWYVGDGVYRDGPEFAWDYYDSYVIHPMLIDTLRVLRQVAGLRKGFYGRERARARRYAAIQERLIAPDGTYPLVGRSLAYRCGAFHALAQSALRDDLPEHVTPAQVRGALTAVMTRTLDAPGTFDADGWLRIGVAGHQPGIGESYVSTGSLYMASLVLLPLGLPPSHPFWADAPTPWTAQRAWAGEPFPIDHSFRTELRPVTATESPATIHSATAPRDRPEPAED
ncbi:MAG: DUF2264 domain-containing protein [Chloroflexi bacterium]|nr:DUF2264 domain-containing protein [Chloroflexota bacterium]